MQIIRRFVSAVILLAFDLPIQAQNFPRYTASILPRYNNDVVLASGFNNRGDVVGSFYSLDGSFSAFLYKDGVYQNLGDSSMIFSSANAINDNGTVVGAFSTVTEGSPAFSNGGLLQPLTPTFTDAQRNRLSATATRINNSGQIVGTYTANTADLPRRSFFYENGQFKDIGDFRGYVGTEGVYSTNVSDINSNGNVVGTSWGGVDTQNSIHAFVSAGGQLTDLGVLPGGLNSGAAALNDSGVVVGYSSVNGNQRDHAVLWDNGNITDLQELMGLSLVDSSSAVDINNTGAVV
ncbi:DUF3466 family protein, partial [Nostoc sp. CHAB 5824]|nr:DUF3466 family protein [Nostoc sp. CHAB 5824]